MLRLLRDEFVKDRPSAVSAAIVDEEESHGWHRLGTGVKGGGLQPGRLIVTGND